jgi:hypothetical protein
MRADRREDFLRFFDALLTHLNRNRVVIALNRGCDWDCDCRSLRLFVDYFWTPPVILEGVAEQSNTSVDFVVSHITDAAVILEGAAAPCTLAYLWSLANLSLMWISRLCLWTESVSHDHAMWHAWCSGIYLSILSVIYTVSGRI